MCKQNVLWALLDLVFIVVFNVVFFVVGDIEHSVSAWMSYGFIHFAYLMVLATPLLVRKGPSSAVFGFSLYSIAATYFFIELIVGVVFIFLNQEDFKPALVVQVILAGAFLATFLSHMIASERTGDAVDRKVAEVEYIKTAAARLKSIQGATGDKAADKALEKAYAIVRTSPTRSNAAINPYELKLLDAIELLEVAANANDVEQVKACSAGVITATNERNQRLRLMQ